MPVPLRGKIYSSTEGISTVRFVNKLDIAESSRLPLMDCWKYLDLGGECSDWPNRKRKEVLRTEYGWGRLPWALRGRNGLGIPEGVIGPTTHGKLRVPTGLRMKEESSPKNHISAQQHRPFQPIRFPISSNQIRNHNRAEHSYSLKHTKLERQRHAQ